MTSEVIARGFNALFPIRAVRKLPTGDSEDPYRKTSVLDINKANKRIDIDLLLGDLQKEPESVQDPLAAFYRTLSVLGQIQDGVRAKVLPRQEQRRIMGEALKTVISKQEKLKSMQEIKDNAESQSAKEVVDNIDNYYFVEGRFYPNDKVGPARRLLGRGFNGSGLMGIHVSELKDALAENENPGKFAKFLNRHF
ncbi:MAG TPA: hypothetical protein VF189_03900 [Patescibacteria group bacterium]